MAKSTYSFSELDLPVANSGFGVSTIGRTSDQIVGYFYDSNDVSHGYVLTGTNFQSLYVPGSDRTGATAVNSSGVVIGSYFSASTGSHNYIYDGSSYTTLDLGLPGNTFLYDINDAGVIVGTNVVGITGHGFIYDHGTVTELTGPAGAVTESAESINASGQIAGSYSDASGHIHGFIYTAGAYQTIDFPASVGTFFRYMNDLGDAVGTYTSADHIQHAFLYTHDGQFLPLDFPGSWNTIVTGISNDGTIVGQAVSIGEPATEFTADPLPATRSVWAHAVDGDFDNAANWHPSGVPTDTTRDVILKAGASSYTVTDSTDHTINNLTIGAGAKLAVTADLQVHGALIGGVLEVGSGGSVAVTETVTRADVHLAGDGASFAFDNLATKTSSITFDAGVTGSIFSLHGADFKATVSGMDDGDMFVFGDMFSNDPIKLHYIENETGTGGKLLVRDQQQPQSYANINLIGDYSLSDFSVGDDGHGHVAILNHHLLV